MNIKAITYGLLAMLLIGSTGGVVAIAQNNDQVREETLETRAFDEAVWQKLNEELDYSGEAPAPKKIEEKEEQDSFNFEDFPTLSPVLQVILMGILIALLAWLIYNIIVANDGNPFAAKVKAPNESKEEVDLQRLEEELDKNDVQPLLFQAEQDKNYHLAVRLHFLALLKKLHTNGNIHWKKDLTNRAYLRQMRPQQEFAAFQSLTGTFERVWYGNQVPDELEYQQIKTAFYAFKFVSDKHMNTPADE